MKKVLLTATVQSHIAQFHKPLINMLKERGYEVHVAAKDNLAEKNGLKLDEPDKIFNQLPIGVFFESIASKNSVFTRGASAIDLWGIGKDKETLHLIELKCGDNKSIGVISELLFYIAVLYDSCITDDPLFAFGKYGNTPETRDLKAIKNEGKKFSRLSAHILAEKYHPLFSSKVESLIQSGLVNLGIGFDRAYYDYSKKVIYENHDL